jgi:fibronectin-binding autotransporter adhesin
VRRVWLCVLAVCLFGTALCGVAVGAVPTNTTPPAISGASPPQVGDVLTETPAVWAGSPTDIQVQWEDCAPDSVTIETCTPIAGATRTTYRVDASDVGFSLLVEETASNADGSEVAVSEGTEVVLVAGTPPAVQAVPKLSGLPLEIGRALTVSTGSWSGTPTPSYTYMWFRCAGGGV